jgi:hypothetical protein
MACGDKIKNGREFCGKITEQQQLLLQAYTISYVLSAAFMDPRMAYSVGLAATAPIVPGPGSLKSASRREATIRFSLNLGPRFLSILRSIRF